MVLKKISRMVFSILIGLAIFRLSIATSHSSNWGTVNMEGSIVDTACAIAIGDRNQSIDMDVLPVSQIVRDGQGNERNFSINLVGCVISNPDLRTADWQKFQITFDGNHDGRLFKVDGEARGIGLAIKDEDGVIIVPGKPLEQADVTSSDMKLNYRLRLVSNNQPLKAGYYFSTIRFKLDYY